MNKVNPKWIGLFVLVGLVALIGLLIVFGGGAFGGKANRYVLFFDQSVNGLNPGATVKFRGVPIGSVERISLRVEGQLPESRAIPVIIALKPRQLERDLGVGAELLSKESMQRAIENGLAARLNLESFVTGLLFIELDFIGAPAGPRFHLGQDSEESLPWMEIPTVPSPFDELTSDIVALIGKVEEMDFAGIVDNFNLLIGNAGAALESVDFNALSKSAVRAMDNLSKWMEDGSIEEAVVAFSAAANAFASAVNSAETLIAKVRDEGIPLGDSLEKTLLELQQLIQAWTVFAKQGDRFLAGDSDLRVDFDSAMQTWSDAARSLRSFVDMLRDNPRSILSGRTLQGFEPGD
jgi:paraquat-inducible protein B